jgi:hypothetical protein
MRVGARVVDRQGQNVQEAEGREEREEKMGVREGERGAVGK